MNLPWIQLVDGRPFEPGNPKKEDFDIEIIAKALSHICRFGGHTKRYYCVAEHSVHVSNMLPDNLKLAGLLHDAHEAYTGYGDVCNPVKTDSIRYLEKNIDIFVAQRFNLPLENFYDQKVKHADMVLLATEKRYLLEPCDRPWDFPLPQTLNLGLDMLDGSPAVAEENFLNCYRRISNG